MDKDSDEYKILDELINSKMVVMDLSDYMQKINKLSEKLRGGFKPGELIFISSVPEKDIYRSFAFTRDLAAAGISAGRETGKPSEFDGLFNESPGEFAERLAKVVQMKQREENKDIKFFIDDPWGAMDLSQPPKETNDDVSEKKSQLTKEKEHRKGKWENKKKEKKLPSFLISQLMENTRTDKK